VPRDKSAASRARGRPTSAVGAQTAIARELPAPSARGRAGRGSRIAPRALIKMKRASMTRPGNHEEARPIGAFSQRRGMARRVVQPIPLVRASRPTRPRQRPSCVQSHERQKALSLRRDLSPRAARAVVPRRARSRRLERAMFAARRARARPHGAGLRHVACRLAHRVWCRWQAVRQRHPRRMQPGEEDDVEGEGAENGPRKTTTNLTHELSRRVKTVGRVRFFFRISKSGVLSTVRAGRARVSGLSPLNHLGL
jgi:hypothetical protein